MKREHFAFLVGGFVFGILFGFGLYHAVETRPDLSGAAAAGAAVPAPRGPSAPTQVTGAPGGAPMVVEINRLKRQLEQDPDSVELLMRLGDLYHGARMWDQSSGFYERAAEIVPDDVKVLTRLADHYHDAQMWDKAAVRYERALEIEPDNPDLLTDLGICFRGLQQFERALELFDKAQGIDPSHWQSLFNTVVVAAFDVGRFDLASDALESIDAIQPRPAQLDPAQLTQLRHAVERAQQGEP